MLILKAQRAPWHIREVNGKYLVMATGKNVLSTLHENIWLWQWVKGIAEMSCCHNCTLHIRILAHLEKMTNKVSTRCQQGVNKVSTRCKICNQRPREKCEVILSVFCLSSEIIFVFVFAFAICFWREGRSSKKNWYFEKMEGGKKETKCGFNKRSITPPYWHSDRVNYNQIDRLLKDIQADKGTKGVQLPNNFPPQATKLYWPGQCVGVVYSPGGLASFGQILWSRAHIGWGTRVFGWDLRTRAPATCTLHIAYHSILFSAQSAQPGAPATCSLHIAYYSIVLHCHF